MADILPSDARRIDDCWNRIGVRGDHSCERLVRHIHCRNCEVYERSAAELLDRLSMDAAGPLPLSQADSGADLPAAARDASSIATSTQSATSAQMSPASP